MFGQERECGVGHKLGCDGGAYMDMWERVRVERGSMYLNICVCSCTCVSMCAPVYLYVCVCICMDSRQNDWWAVGGGEGWGAQQ